MTYRTNDNTENNKVTVETILNAHKEFSYLIEKDFEEKNKDIYKLDINSPEFLRET